VRLEAASRQLRFPHRRAETFELVRRRCREGANRPSLHRNVSRGRSLVAVARGLGMCLGHLLVGPDPPMARMMFSLWDISMY